MILISKQLLSRICGHAAVAYPEECCGILVGKDDVEKRVQAFYQTANLNKQDSGNRYKIDAYEHYKIDKQAGADGLNIIGFYHSHPDFPPYPSEFDTKCAWPGYSYLIISVDKAENAEVRAWVLTDSSRRFVAEDIAYL